MIKLVNMTPHEVRLLVDQGEIRIPPSGTVARAEESAQYEGTVTVEGVLIPVYRVRVGVPVGLPAAPEPGTWYITSRVVADAVRHRPSFVDRVVVPYDLVRDAEGRVVGARALAVVD